MSNGSPALSPIAQAAVESPQGQGPRDLDQLLEEAQGHLQLQMLLIEVASCNEQADFNLIARAYYFADKYHHGQLRKSGHPFLQHCVEVARLLSQWRLDTTTIAAGLLHDVLEDTSVTFAEIRAEFGAKIAALIDGVTKIESFTLASREARQAETYRKMLLSMVEDIRVILIKFADRLHNMRTLDHVDDQRQKRIAQETLDVYAPLAHRFGLARVRWELEDLSLKYLEPSIYQKIRDQIDMKRRQREDYIEEFKEPIEARLNQQAIKAEITGRPKNFYSIYNKMKSRHKPFEEIYDLMAVRIIVETVQECYFTLGQVHNLYRPIPDRFKEYIANPKSNMYQSLHTSVIGPRGVPVEVQIRTWEMHHRAEVGIAAHWRYKSGDATPSDLDQHMPWLRQILDWQQDATDPAEFIENLKIDLFHDEIFIFTPKGELHQLPKGATPIDFAFAVHTDIGLHCLTAKVNNQVVPLSSELHSGDTVQIITSPHRKPGRSWLEIVKTTKARQAVRRWLKEEQYTQSIGLGQELLERELKRYPSAKPKLTLEQVADELALADTEHLYAALGSGDLSVNRVVNKLVTFKQPRKTRPIKQDKRAIRIEGLDHLMIHFGQCCTPIPGDRIIGLITRGRGVSVHRSDCPNMDQLGEDKERLVEVQWALEEDHAFTVQLLIKSRDRKYLLSDITKAISDTESNIRKSSTLTSGQIAEESFWVDVQDIQQLRTTIDAINQIDGVIDVRRVDSPQMDAAKEGENF